MTITFENDNDVICYALEKVISYARRTQQIFVAQCVWWLASVIGLERELVSHIDNLRKCEDISLQESASIDPDNLEISEYRSSLGKVHLSQLPQVIKTREVSAMPRDLTADSRANQVLDRTEQCIEESTRAQNAWQLNPANPLPQTKRQLKKAQKIKRLQKAGKKHEIERNKRLQELREQVISNLSKE
jgi:hypothetical protein